ncbi:activating transcription factor of chaperone [Neodiprion lecontei]|uniref:Activating transcription factor of chaperone n=1 Tax=Neodiprion lecontei TaxID=441921 RepID=A0A6J0B9U5_NEOLC|nr:activating transcription factor of chaperone [Neodiprion lecontei]
MSTDQYQKIWVLKAEPSSPASPNSRASPIETSTSDIFNDWLSFDSIENLSNNGEEVMYEEEAEKADEKTSRAQVATKLLEQLEEFIKEEPSADWLEEKTDLPIFEELSPLDYGISQPILPSGTIKLQTQLQQQETTRTLLQEFESVLGDVEACYQAPVTALTPPQSPPAKFYNTTNSKILISLSPTFQTQGVSVVKPEDQFQEIPSLPSVAPLSQWGAENISLEPLGDVASELAAVDEIVRSCAKNISSSSLSTSSDTSCVSFEEDSNDDPLWTPEATPSTTSTPVVSKNRYRKPYSRPPSDDRKVRKKEQNKNAATRYRQKKKQEIKEIVGEVQELTNYNEKLQGQVGDLQREIRCLKGLMRDLFKAKGLMK